MAEEWRCAGHAGDLTEDGLRKSEYEDYIDHLAGDVIRLAAPGSARKH